MNTCSHCANLKSSIESYPICDDPLSRSARCCLVPRRQFFARPKRFRSRGPSENVPRIRHRSELTERDWENAVQVSYRDLARRGAASLLYRHHAKITVFGNSKPIRYFFRATQELSGIKYTWTGYYRLPSFTSVLKIREFYFFFSAMFSRFMNTGSQFVMEGVKNLVVGNKVHGLYGSWKTWKVMKFLEFYYQ